ncbi:MAG TPA: UDP-glucose 4-epimerase GalE [Bryobacteraceae bacterium]|nr:UDP-glucose 4-epimerase GalE [Bryobacteraceae bacterium]
MPKVLVTGGAGYIGSITAHLLARRGYSVVVVDDLLRGHEHNITDLAFHKLNIADTAALSDVLAREAVDAVVHFAAYIAVGESTQKPELYFSNNVGGTLSLLTAMVQTSVKRLVFSSTAAVYGTPQVVPIPEDSPFDPVSPYGESKVMVEKILGWLDPYRGLRSIKLRYFNACGSDPESGLGEEHDPETHLIPLLLRAVATGNPINIYGDDYETPDGTCIRDYVHVTDLAEAHVLALEKLLAGGASDAFNVGTGAGHSVMEVLRAVEEVTGRTVPYEMGPRRAGDAPALVANSDKLKRALGWKPRFPELTDIVSTAWQFEKNRRSA